MSFIDDEFDSNNNSNNNENEKNFNSIEEEDFEETTLEEFFDKVVVKEQKVQRKVVIIKPDNNSGTGDDAPESISKKFNWGAFLFNWIWGIKYKQWILLIILLLLFIPYGFIPALLMAFWAGMKGNQWAWEEVQYKNEEDFHQAQKAWVKWWFIILGTILVISGIVWLTLPKKQQQEISSQSYSFFTSKELDIPQEVYDDTATNDNYADMLMSDKYTIYWLKPKNEFTLKNKDLIEKEFEENKDLLQDRFVLKYDLIELKDENGEINNSDNINEDEKNLDVEATCIKPDSLCIQAWLYRTCNNGYCIINPKTKKYYKVRGKENVIPKAIRLLKTWE